MRRGQSVFAAAQRLATNHVRNSISDAIHPISKEVAEYILKEMENDMPDVLTNIQELVTLILEQAQELDFLKVYPERDGMRIDIDMEGLTNFARDVMSSIVYSPRVFAEGMDYFENMDINIQEIQKIVVDNIKKMSER